MMEIDILEEYVAQGIIEAKLMRLHMVANTAKWRKFKRDHPIAAKAILSDSPTPIRA